VKFGKSKSTNYSWSDFLKDTDNNGDETVQLDEFNGQPWIDFQFGADRNDNAGISLTEWVNMSPRQANTPGRDQFSQYDLNGDGQVTRNEYIAVSKQ